MAERSRTNYRQSLLSRLLKVRIRDKQLRGMKKLDDINENLRNLKEKFDNKANKVTKIGSIISELFASGSSKFTKPIIEHIAKLDNSLRDSDLKDYNLRPEDKVFGIGEMYADTKKSISESLERDKPNIWSTIEQSSKGFLGKDFLTEWGKGNKGDWFNEPIEGLAWVDRLFGGDSGADAAPNFNYQNGGMVQKYQEGGQIHTGGTVRVKDGDYKKWVMKKDPYTGYSFPEKQTFPKYRIYTMQEDGTWNIGSQKKWGGTKKEAERSLKKKSDILSWSNQELHDEASQYLEGDTGLYKKDKQMEALVKQAQADDETSPSALQQLAILFKKQRPDAAGKSMEVLMAEIKEGLGSIDINLGGETFQDIGDVYKSSLAKSTSTIGEKTAATYDPTMSEREKRRTRGSIGTELADTYGKTSRAYDESMGIATDTEFSTLDELFLNPDVGKVS
tara:strand:+ start:3186 stop:4529 length:1344 start_codon:yes stop_codon:yes gene_type:complete